MALHGKLFDQYEEITGNDQFMLQNKKLLKIQMQYGPVWARSGSMVAYQGDIRFKNKGSGGIGKMFKSAVTGEGVDMMEAEGSGELFVADKAADKAVQQKLMPVTVGLDASGNASAPWRTAAAGMPFTTAVLSCSAIAAPPPWPRRDWRGPVRPRPDRWCGRSGTWARPP